ncbi:MAG: carbohydrate kinase family protein, partial [Caldilineaceae bacterium]
MHLILGTTTVDLFARSDDRFPAWGGEHFQASNLAWCREPLRMVLGGNGANAACVLARLGAAVRLASAVGEDALGALAAGWISDAGVEADAVLRDGKRATATAVVASDIRRQRLIFHHAGAYTGMTIEQLLPLFAQPAAANATFFLTSWPLLDTLRPHYATILTAARDAGYRTVADIGPAIGAPVRQDELLPLLPLIDLLLANDHELSVCLEPEPDSDVPAPWADPAAHAITLLEAGARAVILKMGEGGSTVYRRRDP